MMYEIIHRDGYYEVVDKNGKFICSCDTHKEAMEEIKKLESGD